MEARTPKWGHPSNASGPNRVGAARSFATRFTRQIGTRSRMALNPAEESERLNQFPISVRAELWGGTELEEPTSDRPPAKCANTPVGGFRGDFSEIRAFSQRAPIRECQAKVLTRDPRWGHPPNGGPNSEMGPPPE
jgi:hypothetical protein